MPLRGQLFNFFLQRLIGGTGNQYQRNQGKAVLCVRLHQRVLGLRGVCPPPVQRRFLQIGRGEQQPVLMRMGGAAGRHNAEDLALAADAEAAQQRCRAARDLDVPPRNERLVLSFLQSVAERNKFG